MRIGCDSQAPRAILTAGMTPEDKSRLAKELATAVGAQRVGVARLGPSPSAAYYRDWLARGYAGEMSYLARNIEPRVDPRQLLPGAISAICVAISYRRNDDSTQALGEPSGRVAAYARGVDYHIVLRELLRQLDAELRKRLPSQFESRICVDTAPLLERELAASAGIGWIGKNTLIMHERLGSYLLLGELLTTLDLAPDTPTTDHCGVCTRCLDACPTAAFPAAYQMDASRCISYLTIEKRGDIPAEQRPAIGEWLFGCDICQEVCPHNRKAPLGVNADLMRDMIPARVPVAPLLELRSSDYRRLTRGSATARARRDMWRRNGAIVSANLGASASVSDSTEAPPTAASSECREPARRPPDNPPE